jgi:DNA-binding MarR family transcriptional regulator
MIGSDRVEAWARFLGVSRAVQAAVEADLKAASFPPIAWYDALRELVRDGAPGLRPFELGERLLMAQYTLSRLLDRMERAGLVRRDPCPEDARGQILRVTGAGYELVDEMWPVYREAVARRFAVHLREGEAEWLNAFLERVRPEDRARLPTG